VPELQAAHKESGQDFITHSEEDGSIKDIVRKADNRGHGNYISAYQRHIHSRLALGDAITHGGNSTGKLSVAACFCHGCLDDLRILAIGLMR